VRNLETAFESTNLTSDGRRIMMSWDDFWRRRKAADLNDGGACVGSVKRTMGQSGPRTAEK
jgi:hypothetical protein